MTEPIDLDDLLEGHFYWIKNDAMTVSTGKGGAEAFVKACRDEGIPDEMIKECVFLRDGENNLIPLSQVGIKDNDDEQE